MTETPKSKRGPLPLVLSVTGHRDLRQQDHPALESLVQGVFLRLRQRYPHTPLVLLSALAEGADRLAARVGLAIGARLIVVLPMPRPLYEMDFKSPASLEEFDKLVRQADRCYELPLGAGVNEAMVCQDGSARDRQYEVVGAELARASHILIALWDGKVIERTGGTSQVVRFRLQGLPATYAAHAGLLDPAESGPVYHIVTPRQGSLQVPEAALTLRKLFPGGSPGDRLSEATYERMYQRVEAFNRDALYVQQRHPSLVRVSASYVLSDEEGDRLAAPAAVLHSRFAVADALAIRFQRWTSRMLYCLLVVGLSGALSFQAYSTIPTKPVALAVAYLLLLAAAYGVDLGLRRAHWERKHLDYRALAEALRVQLFWRLSGLPDLVADHYLHNQRSELDWMRQALRTWATPDGYEPPTAPGAALAAGQPLVLVLKRWVEDQVHYYERSSRRDQKKEALIRRLTRGFFLAGLCLAVIKVFLPAEHPLMITIGFALVIAAVLQLYARVRAFSEHAKQYARLQVLFARAREGLQEKINRGLDADARGVIRELGKEALAENADWVMIHRERPIEVLRG